MQFLFPSSASMNCWPDPLKSDFTGQADIEFTSDCNLRCVYCPLSSKTYKGSHMDVSLVQRLQKELPERRICHIGFNGHGETSIIDGWLDLCRPFLSYAQNSHIISNFSRVFDREELEFFSRVKLIIVSFDTSDYEALKGIRRKVDLRTIIYNITNVRATALRMGLPEPVFQVSAGIYDRSVLQLSELAYFCAALRIKKLLFWSLVVHDIFEENAQCDTVDALSKEDLQRAVQEIDKAIDICHKNNIECIIPGDFVQSIRRMAESK